MAGGQAKIKLALKKILITGQSWQNSETFHLSKTTQEEHKECCQGMTMTMMMMMMLTLLMMSAINAETLLAEPAFSHGNKFQKSAYKAIVAKILRTAQQQRLWSVIII